MEKQNKVIWAQAWLNGLEDTIAENKKEGNNYWISNNQAAGMVLEAKNIIEELIKD